MRPTIVSCHYDEDLAWLRSQREYPYIVYSKTDPNADAFITRNVGCENEAYLRFIVDRYDSLPETIAFVHGHERAHHQDGTVLELLAGCTTLEGGYKSLNNHRQCVFFEGVSSGPSVVANLIEKQRLGRFEHLYVVRSGGNRLFVNHEAFRYLLGAEVLPPQYVLSTHSAQFVVDRDLILARPRVFWEGLLERMYALHEVFGNDRREVALMLEVIWFWLLTGRFDETEGSG